MRVCLKSNCFFLVALLFLPLITWLSGRLDEYIFMILMLCGINVILTVSLNLINGIAGQFSLGHAGFMAVGAYVSACLTYYVGNGHFFPWLEASFSPFLSTFCIQLFFFASLIVGGLAAAACGWVVGLPSLRLRGDYLAIVTLGFGEIIRVFILNIEAVGGSRGFTAVPHYTTPAWVFGMVILTIFVVSRLTHSLHGRAFMAIREDEIAAEAVGVQTTRFKVLAFVISSFFAGLAGGLFAHFYSYINPSTFTFLKSFEIIIMVVLGGMGSITGSVVAATALTILPEALRPLQTYTKVDVRMIIYSALLIVMMLTRPNGLFGKRELPQLLMALRVRLGLGGNTPKRGAA
ncbi:MAG TPA: branched-chain amino acid ABC transporter permease [Bdellovibrionota bacterium]|nr:branched-chain amino acid ABC transporter permease [Bdellovibrionota bacterium]